MLEEKWTKADPVTEEQYMEVQQVMSRLRIETLALRRGIEKITDEYTKVSAELVKLQRENIKLRDKIADLQPEGKDESPKYFEG